ncbi:MAG TPA: arginase family protein [Sphingomonas sp.]|nr:arginase family protein [Sphingomonas sp.]
MQQGRRPFDLVLGFPQWQGSGRHENLPRGAHATAAICAQFGPLAQVPLSADLEDAHGVRRWQALFAQFRSAKAVLEAWRPGRILTAGGDCAVDIAVIDYLGSRYPGLTVLWVDAHLDANTPETTPSGSFHGMPVAAIMGNAPEPMRPLLGPPVEPARFRYFGTQVGDEGDWAFHRRHNLCTLDPQERLDGPVHIHFDLDVLDPAEFPHVSYPEGALPVREALALVERIARESDVVGLTVTEFAPADAAAAREGSSVIAQLCEAAASQ